MEQTNLKETKEKKPNTLLTLFLDYLKIGLFSFGGGLAMLPLIERTFVEKRKYITSEELLNITSIAEATPGVIAVNCATYVGYKIKGFLGSLVATIGAVLPSFVIILIVSIFYEKFMQVALIKHFVNGLTIAGSYLIFRAGIKLFKSSKKDALSYILIAVSFFCLMIIKIFNVNFSTIYFILIGGFVSLIVYFINLKITKKKASKDNQEKENPEGPRI